MKRLGFALLFLLCLNALKAQPELSDYRFVVVPERYDFLFEDDQHQLNSMTKFLFNKYGFNAYFENELPNVRRCEGLYANVEGSPGFVWTRLQVVLRDCYGNEVYRGMEGKSKFKEYRKAYQDALRAAFESVAALEVKQPPIVMLEEAGAAASEEHRSAVMSSEEEDEPKQASSPFGIEFIPDEKFSSYAHDGINFLLRQTASGYSFYQEVEEAEDGLVLIGRIKRTGRSLEYVAENGEDSRVRFLEGGDMQLVGANGVLVYKYQG